MVADDRRDSAHALQRRHHENTAPERASLHRHVWLMALATSLALVAVLLPQYTLDLGSSGFLALHSGIEFVSLLLVILIFAVTWHSPPQEISTDLLLMAVALLASGCLDFVHAFLFKLTPHFTTGLVSEEGGGLWLMGHLLLAATLAFTAANPRSQPSPTPARLAILSAYASLCLLASIMVFFLGDKTPKVWVPVQGSTALGQATEWLIIGLFLLAASLTYRSARRSSDAVQPIIFSAIALAGLSEILVSRYILETDLRNLLGHSFKLLSYGFFYNALFIACIHRPYRRLGTQMQLRRKSDQILRTQGLALNATVTPVLVTDLQGHVVWRNRAWQALLGEHAMQPSRDADLFAAPITPDPVVASAMRASVATGKLWRGQVRLQDARGQEVVLEQTVTPVQDEDGAPHGYIAVAENVTQQEVSELRYKRILDMTMDGFWVADMSGQVREVNQAYANMTGYPIEQLLLMNVTQQGSWPSVVEFQRDMRTVMREGQGHFETQLRHRLGHDIMVDISVTHDPEHKLYFAFVRDRSELIQAAAARKALEQQLQQSQKVEQLGRLTGGIAHDFNNSLATILGYSRLALDRFVPDRQSKLASYLGEVVAASERARDLITKMLTFAGTRPSLSAEVVSPAAIINEVVKMLRVSVPSNIQIKTWIEDELYIRIDPSELSQVLVNLIINARDAIGEHGTIDILLHRIEVDGEVCAASHATVSGTFAALEVSDTGAGIAEEHLSRLFDPFFTTKEVGKGTGLGLSMVQGILRRSNAYILVRSEPGNGSLFQLLFPIAERPASTAMADEAKLPLRMGLGQRVWVVDDEPAVARYLGELLEDWGYQVRLFNHPSHLLTAFEAERFDVELVITDQTMPGITGLALAQRLHTLQDRLPIILCSGYNDAVNSLQLQQHGVRRYLMKPINPKELHEALVNDIFASETGPV